MLLALNMTEPLDPPPDPVALRKLSPKAPNAIEVANPLYCQILPRRVEGTRDSVIW